MLDICIVYGNVMHMFSVSSMFQASGSASLEFASNSAPSTSVSSLNSKERVAFCGIFSFCSLNLDSLLSTVIFPCSLKEIRAPTSHMYLKLILHVNGPPICSKLRLAFVMR